MTRFYAFAVAIAALTSTPQMVQGNARKHIEKAIPAKSISAKQGPTAQRRGKGLSRKQSSPQKGTSLLKPAANQHRPSADRISSDYDLATSTSNFSVRADEGSQPSTSLLGTAKRQDNGTIRFEAWGAAADQVFAAEVGGARVELSATDAMAKQYLDKTKIIRDLAPKGGWLAKLPSLRLPAPRSLVAALSPARLSSLQFMALKSQKPGVKTEISIHLTEGFLGNDPQISEAFRQTGLGAVLLAAGYSIASEGDSLALIVEPDAQGKPVAFYIEAHPRR